MNFEPKVPETIAQYAFLKKNSLASKLREIPVQLFRVCTVGTLNQVGDQERGKLMYL